MIDNFKMQQKPKKINLIGLSKRSQLIPLNTTNNHKNIYEYNDYSQSIHVSQQMSDDNLSMSSGSCKGDIINGLTKQDRKYHQSVISKINNERHSQNSCNRCYRENAELVCKFCNQLRFCVLCDTEVHSAGKFCLHVRQIIKNSSEIYPQKCAEEDKNNQQISIKINQVKQVQKINNIKATLTTLNITQVWGEVIVNIQKQFDLLMDELLQKKQEIVKKIAIKRQSQVQKYEETSKNYQKSLQEVNIGASGTMKKSHMVDKVDGFQCKLTQIENQYKIDEKNKQNRYSVTTAQFQQLKNTIKKISLKNIICKNMFESDLVNKHNKVRSSLLSCSNISSMSPGLRTPKNQQIGGKGVLSRSTVQQGENGQINQEQNAATVKNQVKSRTKNEYQLSKVRSQKLFTSKNQTIKSPNSALGKITEYFKSGTTKKNNLKK